MILFAVLFALAGSFLAIPQENAPDPYAVMDRVNRLADKSLWPGFEPRRIPVALFTGAQTLLFAHPNPPDNFIPVKAREGVTAFPGRHESIVANTSVDLGGALTATVMLESLPGKSTAEIAGVVIHEAFHVFQKIKHKDWTTNEALLFTYPMDDVENQASLLLEARALARAVEAKTKAEASRWAACHLNLRLKRNQKYPEAADYERGVELYEGTAHYVEATMLGKIADTKSLALPWRPDQIRFRCYFTGKALAGLLDGMNPGWKQGLESGRAEFLYALLQKSLASAEIEPARFEEAEIAQLTAIAERAVDELRRSRERAVVEFHEKPGIRMVIETQQDNLLQLSGFDPMNILKVAEKEVLHQRMLALSCKDGRLQIVGLPALTIGQGPHPLFNGIKRLEIAGFSETPKISEKENKLMIDSDSLKMVLTNASLTREASIIRIILSSK